MAEVKRTGDHSIWFNRKNYRQKSTETLFETLNALAGGQQIGLIFNGVRGIWARYHDGHVALRPVDQAARQSWQATADRCGGWFPVVLPPEGESSRSSPLDNISERLPPPHIGPTRRESRLRTRNAKIILQPTKHYMCTLGSTLCLGLDVTWWGGGRANPESQNDALSYVLLGEVITAVKTQRVSLAPTHNRNADKFTANCDADAEIILTAVDEIIKEHNASQVILAVDAPLTARARNLPERAKSPMHGTLARREPEQALAKAIADGPLDWRIGCNVQPGAPVCSRVKVLVDGLVTRLGFQIYSHSSPATPRRSLIECFPSEAIWALGCLNHYDAISPGEAREYKTFESRPLPVPLLICAAHRNLVGFMPAIGVPAPCARAWIAQVSSALLTDQQLTDNTGTRMMGGKLFDDVIDSVNCVFTAIAFRHDAAHVWLGADPQDGHIIGPGR